MTHWVVYVTQEKKEAPMFSALTPSVAEDLAARIRRIAERQGRTDVAVTIRGEPPPTSKP